MQKVNIQVLLASTLLFSIPAQALVILQQASIPMNVDYDTNLNLSQQKQGVWRYTTRIIFDKLITALRINIFIETNNWPWSVPRDLWSRELGCRGNFEKIDNKADFFMTNVFLAVAAAAMMFILLRFLNRVMKEKNVDW